MLLRDLIDIPEVVTHSDFVISLQDGITEPDRVVDSYIVTKELERAFQSALGLIASAVEGRASKGAYLHGSFGSGKSHFMAILHLLLEGHPEVRSKPELASVVEAYDNKLQGKKFLLVPYHMVGAASMEAGVLGGYVDHVRKLHPDAPTPPLYLSERLVESALNLREKMGDEAFFSGLRGAGDDDGFGDLAGGWDAARFESAVASPADSSERRALVSEYIDAYAPEYRDVAVAAGSGFVPFDKGLNVISQHAKELGYDGVVLFLDELILWFASRMQDPGFVQKEGQKIAKLVEAAAAERPAPIVSFIARQRDLKEFLGDGVPGADQLNFSDHLEFWDSRFDTITLTDTNLRAIVEKRLLKPKDAAARQELDRAFKEVAKKAGSALDTLMTSEADRKAFRSVYPFSPAMIDTLVAVSSYLQRERTALRLLAQLLMEKRDELKVGDLVPVGDLYDVIRDGEEPFSDQLKRHFESARRLYDGKLRPMVEAEYELDEGELESLPTGHAARTGDRLLKTLILASLVPDAAPLKGLTVRRLANLNHGSIRTPIQGQEAAMVASFIETWSPEIPELHTSGDPADPIVALQLTGVDTQAILEPYRHVDNAGARRSKVRQLVYEALDISDEPSLLKVQRKLIWRGSRRTVDIRFGNVRDQADIPDSQFRAEEGRPTLIIDFPFDDPQHGPADDYARMQSLRETTEATPTVAWLPRFFTEEAQERLGRLVVLDHVLAGDRLEGATGQLSAQDREQAKVLLKNQQSSLHTQMRSILQQAYGIASPESQWVSEDLSLADQFPTLDPTLSVRPPTRPSMTDAFEEIVDQVLGHLYPAHPRFDSTVTRGDLTKCLENVQRAVGSRDGRAEVPQQDRSAVRKVLKPLEIAETGEAHLVMLRTWADHFHKMIQQHPGTPVTVERLREWIDEPTPRGLDPEVQSLVFFSWALQDNRTPTRAGTPVEMAIGRLDPQIEFRTQDLPEPEAWEMAVPRIQALFGVQAGPLRNAANVGAAMHKVREVVRAHHEAAERLEGLLSARLDGFGVPESADRIGTARAVARLSEFLNSTSDDVASVTEIAATELPTSDLAAGRSLKSAAEVAETLGDNTSWKVLSALDALPEPFATEAREIRESVADALSRDELSASLKPVLVQAAGRATDLLRRATSGVSPEPPPPPPPGTRDLAPQGEARGEEAKKLLGPLSAAVERMAELEIRWKLRD